MWSKISRYMDKKGITPYRLAVDNGFNLSTVYIWRENGKVAKIEDLSIIAKYLDVPITELL